MSRITDRQDGPVRSNPSRHRQGCDHKHETIEPEKNVQNKNDAFFLYQHNDHIFKAYRMGKKKMPTVKQIAMQRLIYSCVIHQ